MKKQISILFLLTLLLSMVCTKSVAHDIAVANSDGKTIYYVWTNNNTELAVSYRGSSSAYYPDRYSGNVVIPESVTYNGKTYPVTGIFSYAFIDCSHLTGITIPNSVTTIGGCAFANCTGLTNFTIPNTITSIGYYAFYGCSGLTSITIPNSVTSIGEYAFSSCTGLTGITIPNSVTSIGEYAFAGCSNLESVTIGSGVLSIESKIFDGHKPAKVIWLTNTPPSGYTYAAGTMNYVANNLYTSLSNKTEYAFLSSLFEVDGVKYVPVSPSERTCDVIDCCYDATAENINIGNTVVNKGIALNVKQIKPYAFYRNPYIKNVTLDLTADVSTYAFCGCTELKTATISNNGSIGTYAFAGCTKLETATLGEEVSALGTYAFSGCSSLKEITIPNAVKTIGQYGFQNCSAMTNVWMGTGVKSIETYTFSGCSKLKDMQIGSNVATINTYAFSGCITLPVINIPRSVTDIKNSVFYQCRGLKTISIEDRETALNLGSNKKNSYDYGNPLFSDCPLDSVYIGGNINYSTSSSYGYSPFYRNTTLRSVVITDKETEISENEFYGCTSLKNISIGDGVESIGNWAFSGCSSLDYFAFGTALKTIGKEAFSDCTAVTQITSRAATPPTCGTQALDDINKWECTLHVPENSLAAYQAADQWKEFLFVNENSGNGETPLGNQNALVIGEAGVATYCPTVDVDFTTLTAVKAYIGSGFNRETGVLTMTRVYDVPAGTGLLVKGVAGTYEVPESPSASIYSNLLRGNTVERNLSATTGSYANYVLGSGSNGTGFYRVPAEGTTLAAGRAYLMIPAATAASRSSVRLRFNDGEEATAISDMERQDDKSSVYDLQGRRVEQPRSGLYIRDGKKIIIK